MSGEPSVDGYGVDDLMRLRGRDGDREDDDRSPFARDYDRLVYSQSFRRLQGKTQVVTAGEGDFFRTRLTHTIEVAQVARRLAESLNRDAAAARSAAGTPLRIADPHAVAMLPADQQMIDPDLCEAAAVLHDLGHPPFGHAGEAALAQAVSNAPSLLLPDTSGSFEGNAQSFRLATRALSHHGAGRGLQLTHAVLDAALKYPWVAGDPGAPRTDKWSVYPSERDDLDEVRASASDEVRYAPTVEAQIMDWADDVAYSVHDLEDWYRAGYMPLPRLAVDDAEQARFIEFVVERWRDRDPRAAVVDQLSKRLREDIFGCGMTPFTGFRLPTEGAERIENPDSGPARRAVRRLRSTVFDDAMSSVAILHRLPAGTTVPRRYLFRFQPGDDIRFTVDVLKELLWFYVVQDARIATMQHGQQRLLSELFAKHAAALVEGELRVFPRELAGHLAAAKDDPLEQLRSVADYISGLTDLSARRLHERLRSGGERLHDYL